ncbi:unnamed protein product [Pedinophyceae sp. YPF-701]|nr:unnamed protein product [Pedinophyceae sp. YPF-701]
MPRHALKLLASWLLVAAFFVLCILPAPTTAARALAEEDHHDEEHHDHDDHEHHGDLDGAEHAGLKGGLAAAIFAEAIVGGLVPVLIASSRKYFKYLHLLNALAGGVFLSSGLTHILPEAVHAQEGVNISGPNESYPLAGTCAVIGFIVVLAVERVFFDVHDCGAIASADPKHVVVSHPNATLWERVGNFFVARRSALVLLAALSVHSVLEGLTLGLQATETGVYKMLIAIGSHKWVSSLSLGSHFLMEGTPAVETAIWLIPFALMTPLGIIAGMLSSGRSALTDVVLQGLSAGTFIYVGAVEIAGSELGVQIQATPDVVPAGALAPLKADAELDASEGRTLPPDATVPSGAYKGQLATPHHHINDQCCDHGDARKESFLTGRRGRFVALAMFCLGFLAIALTNLAEHSHAGHGGHDAH